jgi:hypothetical protein
MPISEELTTRLKTYITTKNLQPEDLLFTGNERRYGEHYRRFRNKLAKKLSDTTIKTIRLYDLRHAYLHLLGGNSGEWIVEGTADKNRAMQLIAEDFLYVTTTPDGTMLFKKPNRPSNNGTRIPIRHGTRRIKILQEMQITTNICSNYPLSFKRKPPVQGFVILTRKPTKTKLQIILFP